MNEEQRDETEMGVERRESTHRRTEKPGNKDTDTHSEKQHGRRKSRTEAGLVAHWPWFHLLVRSHGTARPESEAPFYPLINLPFLF